MCRIGTLILLLSIFTMIRAQNQETLYYQVITEQEAADSLNEIQRHEALPIVLQMEMDSKALLPSHFLTKLFTDEGRIIYQTKFGRKEPSRQFLFCPKENSTEKCLVYKEFRPKEPLQCAEEPIPIVESQDGMTKCGYEGAGLLYALFYEICPNQEPYNFTTRKIIIYEFCYEASKQNIIHTQHYISHPKLVNSKVLQAERKVQYDMESIDGFILSYQRALEVAIAEQLEPNEPNSSNQLRQKKLKTGISEYKAQRLIPEEDMAFALWKKPTFQYLNVRLQHEKLIDLWNEINHYIRLTAEKIFVNEGIFISAITAVFDLDYKLRDDGQIPDMWVKVIYFSAYGDKNIRGLPYSAIVLLMHNFVDTAAGRATSSNRITMIDHFCKMEFCAESLKKKFDDVGGQIRCCSMNTSLARLLGEEKYFVGGKIIPIPGVTEIIE